MYPLKALPQPHAPRRLCAALLLQALVLWSIGSLAGPADSTGTVPSIRGIRPDGTNVIVTVYSPESLKRITIETRPRMGTGNWIARDFAWPDGQSGEFTFTLPQIREVELIRVRGDDSSSLPLPSAFYKGRSFFDTIRVSQSEMRGGMADSLTPATGGNVGITQNFQTTPTSTPGSTGVVRDVVESDIWQLDGTTLYFFNQFRGLQVIDVQNPDAPKIQGQLPMASVGEQMYLLPNGEGTDTRYVALLTREGCSWNQGSVVIARVEKGVPHETARLKLSAQVRESRLVGEALYVATQGWMERHQPAGMDPKGNVIPESVYWENTTTIESFDLSNPAAPVVQPIVALAANPNAITATDRFLFLAVTGSQSPQANKELPPWSIAGAQSILVFDISDPHGHVEQLSYLSTAGQVADKFKLNLQGDILSVVSQRQAVWDINSVRPSVTQLETFSLQNPILPVRLGHLPIITNETVYATRFDGNRAYVVTFRQTDPLWIIDLADPAHPHVQGELQIPGWSTYIHPMGDRLIAMGQENWGQPSVSLYDVAEAAAPKLLSRVPLGVWAWSEASSDEKAFKVFPDAGLILLPWSGQRTNQVAGSYFQGMQLIDFNRDKLTPRGVIEHTFQARRATLHQDRILSISGTELISANYTDRDHPTIQATLELAPQTDRLFLRGDQLVGITYPNGTRPLGIHIAPKSNPDLFLSTLSLSNWMTVGLELKDRYLQVVQKENETYHTEERVQAYDQIVSLPQPPLLVYKTNETTSWIDTPPLISYITNDVVKLEIPPRQVIGSNWVAVIIPLPPIPGGGGPLTVTNYRWRLVYDDPQPVEVTHQEVLRVETPQPPHLGTNYFVTKLEVPQAPVLQTNHVVVTNLVWLRDPLFGWLTVVDVDAKPAPVVIGQTRFEFQSDYYGNWLTALWPDNTHVVWAPAGYESTGYLYPMVGGMRPMTGIAIAIDTSICLNCGNFPMYGSSSIPELLAFDLSNPGSPQLVSRIQPARPESDTIGWSGSSTLRMANGKVYFSHTLSEYIPPAQSFNTVTNAEGIAYQLWQYGEYHYTHWLNVVDYANPAQPTLQPPVPFPGPLKGLSHAASLLYAQTSGTNGTAIAALAYDGTQAFLVDSLPIPNAWPQPTLVLDTGHVLIGQPASTNTEPATLETWQVNQLGKFNRYASQAVASPIQSFTLFGSLLAASANDSSLLLYNATDPNALVQLKRQTMDCNYWFDLGIAKGSLNEGIWIPRGIQGVWHIPTEGN